MWSFVSDLFARKGDGSVVSSLLETEDSPLLRGGRAGGAGNDGVGLLS